MAPDLHVRQFALCALLVTISVLCAAPVGKTNDGDSKLNKLQVGIKSTLLKKKPPQLNVVSSALTSGAHSDVKTSSVNDDKEDPKITKVIEELAALRQPVSGHSTNALPQTIPHPDGNQNTAKGFDATEQETSPQTESEVAAAADITPDLTPKAVAEYLILTGDFNGFDEALIDLLETKIFSPEEARQYREEVSWEYQTLLQQMIEKENQYLQAYDEQLEAGAQRPAGLNQVELQEYPADSTPEVQSSKEQDKMPSDEKDKEELENILKMLAATSENDDENEANLEKLSSVKQEDSNVDKKNETKKLKKSN